MLFFSSVVRRTIFRVVLPLLDDESLPLDEEDPSDCNDVDEGDCGRVGSGIR